MNDIPKKRIAHNKSNTKDFIEKAKKVFPEFNYDKVDYVCAKTKVIIGCPRHGDFLKIPNDLLNKTGCPICKKDVSSKNGKANKYSDDFVLEEFQKAHGDRYSYKSVEYNRYDDKVEIICSIHGSFFQRPFCHANGQGCPECAMDKNRENIAQTTEKAAKSSKRRKDVLLPSKKIISLQGYEPYVYDSLLDSGYLENDIITLPSMMPKISYLGLDNKRHRYIPDIYIPKENLLIEVKSTYTEQLDKHLYLKLESAKRAGYNIELIVLGKITNKLKHIKVKDYTKQGDKEAKRLERKENNNYFNYQRPRKTRDSNLNQRRVHCVELGITFKTPAQAAKFFGSTTAASTIAEILNKNKKSRSLTACGYTWELSTW